MTEEIFMDHTFVISLNQFAVSSPFFSGTAQFFAHYLPWIVSAVLAVVLLRSAAPRRLPVNLLALVFGGAFLSWLIAYALRLFIHRPRPFSVDPTIFALVEKTSYSFPSGHAAFFFALSTVVFLHNRMWGWWLYGASLLIGIARIAAGVHYPTDILAGAALGIAVGWLTTRLRRYLISARPAAPQKENL